MDKMRGCGHFKVDGDMFGAWKPYAAKAYSRIMLEALQPVAFRENWRALFAVDTPIHKDPSALMDLIRDQGLRWPDTQWVLGADHRSRSGRRGTGYVAGDARNHCGGEVTSFARVATNQQYYQNNREIPGNFERRDQRTQVFRPKRFTGRDPDVCSVCHSARDIRPKCSIFCDAGSSPVQGHPCFTDGTCCYGEYNGYCLACVVTVVYGKCCAYSGANYGGRGEGRDRR